MRNGSSPSTTATADLPVALRPMVDFSPTRGSIFDDPGDEKSWHVSQRSEALSRFYADREPAWYGSAIASLKGAKRVLDLGCGPGIALQALLEEGCESVLGVDRWPDFVLGATPEAPIVAHDLSLPMPFLESASFDGVLSHYVLDYVSPICLRQVLRETHRLLVPGGRLALYVAAVGLGGGDESRTVAYLPATLHALLDEAGFADVEVTAEGRNSVAKVRRGGDDPDTGWAGQREVISRMDGDTELSASFAGEADSVRCEVLGEGRAATFAFDLPWGNPLDDERTSVCVRALARGEAGTELQLWIWRGLEAVAMECARLEFAAAELRLSVAGARCGHASIWQPRELSLEPTGNAHSRFDDLRPGETLTLGERGEEGRQIVVEGAQTLPPDAAELLRPGRNRLLVKRAPIDIGTADREWMAGRLHGIALGAGGIGREQARESLLWANWRQSMVYLDGSDWGSIFRAASEWEAELQSSLILVDPALSGDEPAEPLPPELIEHVLASDRRFVLLGPESRMGADRSALHAIRRRLLYGGPHDDDEPELSEANENLRYLSERTLLMRLRQAHGFSPAEVGRRSPLS